MRYKRPVRKHPCRTDLHACSSLAAEAQEVELTPDKRLKSLAEGVGFEPTDACTSAVFKTAAIDHSATLPLQVFKTRALNHPATLPVGLQRRAEPAIRRIAPPL